MGWVREHNDWLQNSRRLFKKRSQHITRIVHHFWERRTDCYLEQFRIIAFHTTTGSVVGPRIFHWVFCRGARGTEEARTYRGNRVGLLRDQGPFRVGRCSVGFTARLTTAHAEPNDHYRICSQRDGLVRRVVFVWCRGAAPGGQWQCQHSESEQHAPRATADFFSSSAAFFCFVEFRCALTS